MSFNCFSRLTSQGISRFMRNLTDSEGGQEPTFAFWKNLCFNNSEDVGLKKKKKRQKKSIVSFLNPLR